MQRAVISFEPTDPDTVGRHLRDELLAQPHLGDFFIGHHQLTGTPFTVLVDAAPAGLAVTHGDAVNYLRLADATLERRALAALLDGTSLRQAIVASWDAHHVDLFGGFATGIHKQAFQFELTDLTRLATPQPGLTIRPAGPDDIPWLSAQAEFADEVHEHYPLGNVRVLDLDATPIGIGLLVPHETAPERAVDLGDYIEPAHRNRGYGTSLLVLLAREALAQGKLATCGCYWRNEASRRQIEKAGFTCVGTVFRLDLDPAAAPLDWPSPA